MKSHRMGLSLLAASFVLAVSAPVRADTSDLHDFHAQTGYASYYAQKWNDLRTASGERFDPKLLTAAHSSLPLGSWVRVTNLYNGRSVNVRINDRNAPSHTRLIDLSHRAAELVGMIRAGVAKVKIELIPPPKQMTLRQRLIESHRAG